MGQKYKYQKKISPETDRAFQTADIYGKVKLKQPYIFWKQGLSWNVVSLSQTERIYRRVEAVNTKMCCGNVNFDIQKLVLILKDGAEIVLHIGDGVPKEAEALYQKLQTANSDILFGKP